MAPRAGETADEKINRLYTAANKTIVKAKFNEIVASLKEHPKHVNAVHRQLRSLGAIGGAPADPAEAAAKASPSKPLAIEDGTPSKAASPKDVDGEGAMGLDDDAATGDSSKGPLFTFDKNTTRVEHLSPTCLETAFSMIEPASMSKANLKKITKRGARDQNQKVLVKYWEYATGKSPGMPLPKAGPKSWDSFVEDGKTQNQLRGRRLADVVLPLEFYTDGLYSWVLVRPGLLELTKKTRNGKVAIELAVPKQAIDFTIEQNWSENSAVLTQVDGPFVKPLSSLFGQSDNGDDTEADGAASSSKPARRLSGKRASQESASAPSGAKVAKGPKAPAGGDGNVVVNIDSSTMQSLLGNKDIQLKFNPQFKKLTK